MRMTFMRILLFGFFYFTGSPAQRVFLRGVFSFSVFTPHVWLPILFQITYLLSSIMVVPYLVLGALDYNAQYNLEM